jgi:hypothetical protein
MDKDVVISFSLVWLLFLQIVDLHQCMLFQNSNGGITSRFNIVEDREWFLVVDHKHGVTDT